LVQDSAILPQSLPNKKGIFPYTGGKAFLPCFGKCLHNAVSNRFDDEFLFAVRRFVFRTLGTALTAAGLRFFFAAFECRRLKSPMTNAGLLPTFTENIVGT
jgi:hypothetical protein